MRERLRGGTPKYGGVHRPARESTARQAGAEARRAAARHQLRAPADHADTPHLAAFRDLLAAERPDRYHPPIYRMCDGPPGPGTSSVP